MIPVCVVEDHPVYLRGIAQLIEETSDLTPVAVCRRLEDMTEQHIPAGSVILLDLHLPGEDGPPAVERLSSAGHLVLVLSASTDRTSVVDAMRAGACGYLDKGADAEVIVDAIRIVAGGGTYVSSTLASLLLDAGGPRLTPRERDVLCLVAEGASDKVIARELDITINTVHAHLDRIRDKTGRRRRADLTRLAIEEHIVGGDGET